MARKTLDVQPWRLDKLVESEHKAGTDLAWIVILATILCVLAIGFAVPDAVFDQIEDTSGLNVNGVVALITVVPLGASVFAFRRYRDAVAAQRELSHLSLHDSLTGLPNRRHLRQVLPEAFHHARRFHTRAAVLFIDLDGFKMVNDTYGHEVGDRLMVAVADRLARTAGEDRWAARYAGDEFVIVDPAPSTAEAAARFAQELIAVLETPFDLGEDHIAISASIGIAYGDVTDDADDVLRDADAAMYDAKNSDNRTAVFSETMRARLTPATAERRLQKALEDGEFRLLYQPIVALRTSRIVGCEGLLRWHDPERGMIPPGDFLGSLEDTGLIVPVGRWVFEEACRQAADWAKLAPDTPNAPRVTTNISPRQIGQADFVDDLRSALTNSDVDPSLMYLEVTESALIGDPRAAWSSLTAARELGIGLALDDFGTGYSSLSHLRTFEFELLKLDSTYVGALGGRPTDDAIVRHVVSLARALDIATVAKGISEAAQVEKLLDLGCELGQGSSSPRRNRRPSSKDSFVDSSPPVTRRTSQTAHTSSLRTPQATQPLPRLGPCCRSCVEPTFRRRPETPPNQGASDVGRGRAVAAPQMVTNRLQATLRRPVEASRWGVNHSHRDLDQRHADSEPLVPPAVMFFQHEERVAQLEIRDPLDRGAHAGISHHRSSHDATGPPRPSGADRKLALLAVGEVALVEQSDLFETGAATHHQRAVGVISDVEADIDRRRRVDGPEERIDHGPHAIAHIGAHETDPRTFIDLGEHLFDRVEIRKCVVRSDRDPLPSLALEESAKSDVAAGPEPEVVAGKDQFGVTDEVGKCSDPFRVWSRCRQR